MAAGGVGLGLTGLGTAGAVWVAGAGVERTWGAAAGAEALAMLVVFPRPTMMIRTTTHSRMNVAQPPIARAMSRPLGFDGAMICGGMATASAVGRGPRAAPAAVPARLPAEVPMAEPARVPDRVPAELPALEEDIGESGRPLPPGWGLRTIWA